jgi:hypothetical protein
MSSSIERRQLEPFDVKYSKVDEADSGDIFNLVVRGKLPTAHIRINQINSKLQQGLSISEVWGLKWMDIDWKALQMDVTRSVVTLLLGSAKRRPLTGQFLSTS